jgi:hypothetical protein
MVNVRSSLFRDVRQRTFAVITDISGQHIGPIFKSCPETSTTILRSVILRKSEDLIYTVAEAWNYSNDEVGSTYTKLYLGI